MTKGLWVYCLSPLFSKTCTFLYFYIVSHLFSFWDHFPLSPCTTFFPFSPPPFSKNLICNLKPSLIYKLSLAVFFFCSNTGLITTPSSSKQFFSFFDMLPSAPTTSRMALLIILIFHILLISLFSSWYQFFPSLSC